MSHSYSQVTIETCRCHGRSVSAHTAHDSGGIAGTLAECLSAVDPDALGTLALTAALLGESTPIFEPMNRYDHAVVEAEAAFIAAAKRLVESSADLDGHLKEVESSVDESPGEVPPKDLPF